MSDKIRLDANQLTLRDIRRARVALEGQDPLELLGSGDRMVIAQLIGWCVRSRDDAEFTWDDALDLSMGDFEFGESDQPPPTASPDGPGTSDAPPAPSISKARPPKPGPPNSSASSSA